MLQSGLLQSHAAAMLSPQCSSPLPGVMSALSRRSRSLLCVAGGAGAGACSSGDVAAGRAQARLRRLLAAAARVSSHAVYQSQSHCMRGCSHCSDAVCSGPWLSASAGAGIPAPNCIRCMYADPHVSAPLHYSRSSMHPICACSFKTKALAGLQMGTENRVAMLFPGPEPFWPPDPHFLRPLTG